MSNKRKLKEMQVQLDKLQAHTVRLTSDVSGLIAKVCEPVPKSKTLDHSVFDGLDEKWRFAAVVEDGRALYFNKRPCGSDDITGHFVFKGDYQASFCGNDYNASDWQNSLIERESELTGSDLCRAMLERGDKFVMCSFSDDSDKVASLGANEGVCVGWCAEFRTYKTEWEYAVPINNMGEPLTAKEAGL